MQKIAFDKIQHLFMIKTLSKMGIEGTDLNTVKTICGKYTVNIIFNAGKAKSVLFKMRNKTRLAIFNTCIQ